MNKTNIEWTDYTWNPIKGLCPVACWYCYARKMYKRFKMNPKVMLDPLRFGSCNDAFEPNVITYEDLWSIGVDKKVFVCSTFELFHPQAPKVWRDGIFQAIIDNPQITFQILTKMPENIDRPMPDNVWLGVSITKNEDAGRIFKLRDAKAKIKFVSYEPILGPAYIPTSFYDWLILGRLTGHGKKHDPRKSWVETMVEVAKSGHTPLFMKNNLKDIWGKDLIQEFPK